MMKVPPRRRLLLGLAGLAASLCLAAGAVWWHLAQRGAPPELHGPAWLRDATDEVGLDFVHDAGPSGDYFMPQIMGAGLALVDVDNDGLLDVLLLQSGGPLGKKNQLFKQLPDGTFRDVSAGSGLDFAGFNTGVAVGDVNNDGWPDLVITQYGGVRLLLNKGDGTFTDVTERSGLHNLGWGTSCAFVDYDRDGWLDLVIVNYVAYDGATVCTGISGARDYCHPRQFPGQTTRLFRNLGKDARFADMTEQSGLGKRPGPGLGVVCADFDGDGWPDLFVANDGRPNHLWINQQNGTFREEAVQRGLAFDGMGRAPANMGVALGDVGGDGLFDLFVTHLTEETHTLWVQGPRGQFVDRTAVRGLAPSGSRGTGFGTILADLDNDGSLDVAVVNGRVAAGKPLGQGDLGAHYSRYAEFNQLFANDGMGYFVDRRRADPAFCGLPGVFRGLVCGDLRNNGALDLVITSVAGRARLFRNVVPNRGNWLGVRVIDPALKRDAYGAEVVVEGVVEGKQRRWTRWIIPGTSYQSSNDPRAHFGLGTLAAIDQLRVRWPDGTTEVFAGRSVNVHRTLRKGEGKR